MSQQELIKAFTTSCWQPLSKELIKTMKTLDKEIPNFQLYFNAKKYNNSKKQQYSDIERYKYFIDAMIDQLIIKNDFDKYLLNKQLFFDNLKICFKSAYETIDTISVNFLKSSYQNMVNNFNRILNPIISDDDDNENEEKIDVTEDLKHYVKSYAHNFIELLNLYIGTEGHLYESNDDLENIKNKMFEFSMNKISVLNIYSDKITLWISKQELENYKNINIETFMKYIDTDCFNLNPIHSTNLDTLKRCYMNKQKDLFVLYLTVLNNNKKIYLYKTDYKFNAEFTELNEMQLNNRINSFPKSLEDYEKLCLAIFYFNKSETIVMNGYWLLLDDVENVIGSFDRDAFIWTEITNDVFVNNIFNNVSDNVQISILH